MTGQAKEKAIADILAQHTSIAQSTLGVNAPLSLLRQEHVLPNGKRSDLLFHGDGDLILVELKVTPACADHLSQIQEYVDIYQEKLLEDEFPGAELRPILLTTGFDDELRNECRAQNIVPQTYDPGEVLGKYQSTVHSQIVQSNLDVSANAVNHFYLVNGVVDRLASDNPRTSKEELAEDYSQVAHDESNSPALRIGKLIRLARGYDLVTGPVETPEITDRGRRYSEQGGENSLSRVTPGQAREIEDLLYTNPHHSEYTYATITLIETIFDAYLHSDRVTTADIRDDFIYRIGANWNADSTRRDGFLWNFNYAEDFGLIRTVGEGPSRQFYLTPAGFRITAASQITNGRDMIRAFGGGMELNEPST